MQGHSKFPVGLGATRIICRCRGHTVKITSGLNRQDRWPESGSLDEVAPIRRFSGDYRPLVSDGHPHNPDYPSKSYSRQRITGPSTWGTRRTKTSLYASLSICLSRWIMAMLGNLSRSLASELNRMKQAGCVA